MERGLARVAPLGPVLGPLHPIVAENIEMLRGISMLDEVSFHMSGTEAVMAAVRLARFNTRRKLIVCFGGAYHGWWDGVRAGAIARVLVNPMQAFHPNAPPPSDAVMLTSAMRRTEESTRPYGEWLAALRRVCDERDARSSSTRSTAASGSPPAAPRRTSACRPTWSSTARPSAVACRSAWCAGARRRCAASIPTGRCAWRTWSARSPRTPP